jgi:transcriptional regulator with XRE-family HTH domain
MTSSARIRRARMLANLSQTELSGKLGVTRSSITQWERVQGTKPSMRNLVEVATICQVQFEWLATGRGVMRIGDTHQEPPAHMSEFAFTELESRLLNGFRRLAVRKQDAIVDLVEKLRA